MKRVFNCGKKHKAFSMAEMLVVMLILAIVIISMTPVAVKRVKKETVNPEHGSFECYWDGDTLYQVERNAQGLPLGIGDAHGRVNRTTQGFCEFTPRRGAMFYTVNAVGGGSPGTGNPAAFQALPINSDSNQNDLTKAGVNFFSSYRKYRSVFVDTSVPQTVNYNDMTYGTVGTDSPVGWLNDNGLNLLVLMVSDGGELTNETKAGVLLTTLQFTNSKCATEPGLDQFTYGPEGNQYFSEQIVTSYIPYKTGRCWRLTIYPGYDPAPGGYLAFLTTIPNGGTINNNGNSDGKVAAPEFAAGAKGCRLTRGGNGGFGSNTATAAKYENYSSAVKCTPISGRYDMAKGHAKEHYTVTAISPKPTGQHTKGSVYCVYDTSTGLWTNVDGSASCTPVWDINDTKNLSKPWNIKTFGNFALIWNELTKGVNFYARGGNPGEYRTLYIPRLTKTVHITPGKPKEPVQNDNSVAGNDTIMSYSDGKRILTAPGGKRPISSKEIQGKTAVSTTFIVGDLFDPTPAPGHVIAYDTTSGVQTEGLLAGNDDASGHKSEYGTYFLPKDSGFIYPIPDINNPIPDTVGQGGHGAYTIYRRPGKANSFAMHRLNSAVSADSSNTSAGSVGANVTNAYTCKSDSQNLSGNTAPASYRCKPGSGQGGAVVITW